MKVIIEISAHHCHISRRDLALIYGPGHELTPLKPLSQTGQFAAKETVDVKVGGKVLKNLRILGPERKSTQIEISLTEGHYLKIKPPVKECTCPDKPGGCILAEIIGPKGKISRCAIIVAQRHFHTDPETAKKLKLKNKQMIALKTPGGRGVIFNNILVRIDPSFLPRIHLDTDEANAAGLESGEKGELIIVD